MAKLACLWQEMKIEFINLAEVSGGILKVGGEVSKSNFLEVGKKSLMPLFATKNLERLSIGDVLKITLYTPKGETEYSDTDDGRSTVSFKDCGTRYELWNEEAGGWDKLFEILKPQA